MTSVTLLMAGTIGPGTATETFDVGVDLGSPVSLNYFDRRPFEFTGRIATVRVNLK